MNFPSRGLRESATTIRYVGCFFRPVRRRRILTAIGTPLQGSNTAPGSSRTNQPTSRTRTCQVIGLRSQGYCDLRPETCDLESFHLIPNMFGLNFPPPPGAEAAFFII